MVDSWRRKASISDGSFRIGRSNGKPSSRALPSGPLEASLLPGQSFFDLCAQAFPSGRVVLNEHFRCEANIIEFCNSMFYDDQLVPLRLPLQSERITPSLVDVKLDDGEKVGKTNEKEAEEIVRRVQIIVSDPTSSQRTIGIISLMGDEQSRLIRGLLLDSIGPQLMSSHDVLVGDPPAFQGAERDGEFITRGLKLNTPPPMELTLESLFSNFPLNGVFPREVPKPESALSLSTSKRRHVEGP
jgi:AAA domain